MNSIESKEENLDNIPVTLNIYDIGIDLEAVNNDFTEYKSNLQSVMQDLQGTALYCTNLMYDEKLELDELTDKMMEDYSIILSSLALQAYTFRDNNEWINKLKRIYVRTFSKVVKQYK